MHWQSKWRPPCLDPRLVTPGLRDVFRLRAEVEPRRSARHARAQALAEAEWAKIAREAVLVEPSAARRETEAEFERLLRRLPDGGDAPYAPAPIDDASRAFRVHVQWLVYRGDAAEAGRLVLERAARIRAPATGQAGGRKGRKRARDGRELDAAELVTSEEERVKKRKKKNKQPRARDEPAAQGANGIQPAPLTHTERRRCARKKDKAPSKLSSDGAPVEAKAAKTRADVPVARRKKKGRGEAGHDNVVEVEGGPGAAKPAGLPSLDEVPRIRAPHTSSSTLSPPPSALSTPDAPDKPPAKRGIPSSTFAAVLRLVASLDRPRRPAMRKRVAPACRPPVWAESRQELCEALPYYRAFQSGLYMYKRVPFGYLLDGFSAPRDVWAHDGRVIVSHGGGQAVRVFDAGGRATAVLAADQTRADARIDTLVSAAERRAPVVLIAGEGYGLLPWDVGCAYAVLGWYWVSASWAEAEPVARGAAAPENRDWYARVKVRFDWVASQGTPWWTNTDRPRDAGADGMASFAPKSSVHQEAGRRTQTMQLGSSMSGQTASLDSAGAATLVTRYGLLTPPNTPTEPGKPSLGPTTVADRCMTLSDVRAPPAQDDRSLVPQRTHYPGDLCLADFGEMCAEPGSAPLATCPSCSTPTPQVYAEGLICLVPSCPQFWMLETPLGLVPIPPGFALSYHPPFLEPRPGGPQDVPYAVAPPAPAPDTAGAQADAGSRALWRGWVCACGRANCRYRWEMWECRACGATSGVMGEDSVVPACLVEPSTSPTGIEVLDNGLAARIQMISGSTVFSYVLPDAGTVYHVRPAAGTRADALFEAYQRTALCHASPLFERRALRANVVKGPLLSQQFAVNAGASYKYIVDSQSHAFADSPRCVTDALDVIRDTVRDVVGERVEFNEILSVMYREGQKMSWHDDGEKGLGPTVAALSLGSTATMSFRPKLVGRGKKGHYGRERKATSAPTALSLTLAHGDVVVMHGRETQMRYEHRVIPHGLRVAATARNIGAV
ncbi:hypothetical protein Q5752_006278 [Cryptotrichosporon argae]